MFKSLRAAVFLGVAAAAAPTQATYDFSKAIIEVTDLGGGSYTFAQGGWSAGGVVTGTFSGTDLDNNGQLNSFLAEITEFSMQFSGDAEIQPFALDFGNLYGLVYDLDGGPLGDVGKNSAALSAPLDSVIAPYSVEGFSVFGESALYVAGPGALQTCGSTLDCAIVLVTPADGTPSAVVPEPANWALMIAGFGLTGAALRQRRAYRIA